MDYITNYYKNLSEQLQEKVNILNNNLKYLTEMEAPIPTQGNPGQGTGIDPRMFDPRLQPPFEYYPLSPYHGDPEIVQDPLAPPRNPANLDTWEDGQGGVWQYRISGDGRYYWHLIRRPENAPPGYPNLGNIWTPRRARF